MKGLRRQAQKIQDRNLVFVTGAPRSATRSMTQFFKDEFKFEHSYHETYSVLTKMFSLSLYRDHDISELRSNSRPVVGTRKKIDQMLRFFRNGDSDHLIDVDWMNSYAMYPISCAFPKSRWIVMYRPIDQVANSMTGFLSDETHTWPIEVTAEFWLTVWKHILGQLPHIENDLLMIRFDKYINGQENRRIAEFLNLPAPKAKPKQINKRRIDYKDQEVPKEFLIKAQPLEEEALKYYA